MKEFYVSHRMYLDPDGDKILLLELRHETQVHQQKVLLDGGNFEIKYANAAYLTKFLVDAGPTQDLTPLATESKNSNLELPEEITKKIQEVVKAQFQENSEMEDNMDQMLTPIIHAEKVGLKKHVVSAPNKQSQTDILRYYNNPQNCKKLSVDFWDGTMQARVSFFPNQWMVLSLATDILNEGLPQPQSANRDIPDDATHVTMGTRLSKMLQAKGKSQEK